MFDVGEMYEEYNSQVAVNYIVYDPKRRLIVNYGTSRVCGENNPKESEHAEELAIKYCINNKNKDKFRINRYQIIIWKFNKDKMIKPIMCCSSCTRLSGKYNMTDNMYTISGNTIISAISKNPKHSLWNICRKMTK